MNDDLAALLVIAHGTRDPRGAEEMAELVGLCADRHRGPVGHAWLEDFADPSVPEAVTALAAQGVRRIGAVRFLNFAAYHANTDVPAEVRAAQEANPQVEISIGPVLGHHPALLELARERVGSATDGELLVVAASGSSNAQSNSEVAKAARLLAEVTGHRWVEVAFAGVTWPRVDEVLQRAHRAGARRVALFSWSLLAGLLSQKVSAAAADAAASLGLELRDTGRFGAHPLVADAVVDRWQEGMR